MFNRNSEESVTLRCDIWAWIRDQRSQSHCMPDWKQNMKKLQREIHNIQVFRSEK